MAKLEDKVRDALCKTQADDSIQTMHNPSHQNFLKDLFRDVIKKFM